MDSAKNLTRQDISKIRVQITASIRELQGTGSLYINDVVNDLNRLRILLADLHQNGSVIRPLVLRILKQIERVQSKVEKNKRIALLEVRNTLKPLA